MALFTDTFDEISGVGLTFHRFANHCRQRSYPLDIFTVSPDHSARDTDGSVTIHRIKPRIPVNYYPGLYFDLVPLDETVVKYGLATGFDVVHVATPGHIGITGLYLALKLNRPLIGSYHTELPEYVSQRLINHLDPSFQDDPEAQEYVGEVSSALTWDYLACFYNHCAKVLVPSDYTRRQVSDRLRSPLAIFPRGVDTALFDPAKRQRSDSKVRLLFVGRLAVEKNLDWLVRYGQSHPEHELMIVGDGPEREALQTALPDAIFTGFLRGDALAHAYADADLFAFPSHTETFGNVVLEAQASGLPAVVSDRGGPSEIIEPQVSGLVAGDYEAFEASLQALAGDPARRTAFGKAARQRAQQRSWSGVFEGLLQQYRSVEYPYRRKLFLKVLRTLKESDSPVAVGLVSFWKQFGKRRAQQEAQRSPLMIASRLAVLDSQRTDRRP